jgi:hypothetical protein
MLDKILSWLKHIVGWNRKPATAISPPSLTVSSPARLVPPISFLKFMGAIGKKGGSSRSPKKVRAARRNLEEAHRVARMTPWQKRLREGQLRRAQLKKKSTETENVETQDSTEKVSFGNPKSKPPSEGS